MEKEALRSLVSQLSDHAMNMGRITDELISAAATPKGYDRDLDTLSMVVSIQLKATMRVLELLRQKVR